MIHQRHLRLRPPEPLDVSAGGEGSGDIEGVEDELRPRGDGGQKERVERGEEGEESLLGHRCVAALGVSMDEVGEGHVVANPSRGGGS